MKIKAKGESIHKPTNEHVKYIEILALDRDIIADKMKMDGSERLLPFWRGGIHLAMYLNGLYGCAIENMYIPSEQVIRALSTEMAADNPPCIYVEDIVDTGQTIVKTHLRRNYGGFQRVLSIAAKPRGITFCENHNIEVSYLHLIPDDAWAVFPWEARIEDL